MAKTIETVATINSAVRTLLALIICGALGTGGYVAYDKLNEKDSAVRDAEQKLTAANVELDRAKKSIASQQEEIVRQSQTIEEQIVELKKKDEKIEKLEIARRLLKVDHRLAQLNVIDQMTENGQVTNTLHFIELNPEGVAMGPPKVIVLKGDMIYVDGLSVTFQDRFVEDADLERGTSLFSFTRMFTDLEKPKDGVSLDEVNTRPSAYGKGPMSAFEKNIWDNFWTIANDKEKANRLGIASIHGSAVSIKPVKGNSYTIELRASAGPKLKNEGKIPMTAN